MTKKKKYRDVESMTDAEFEALTREIAGEQVVVPEIAFDPRYMEKRDNPTIVKGNYYASGSHHDDKSRHIEIDKEDDLPKLPEK